MNARPSRRIESDQPSPSPLEVNVPESAWDRILAGLQSELMTQQQLADLFGVGRNKISAVLKRIEGAERLPGGWRVPIAKLPPAYFMAAGLMPLQDG